MQKRILFLAVAAAAMAAPSAFADTSNVNIYGQLDLDMARTDTGSGGTSTMQVASQVSKIGFKGSEDLGGGTSAIWQIEQQINIDNPTGAGGTGTFATRNSFVGLSSKDAGTLILGRNDTPYKLATRRLDVFGDTIADNRSLMGGGATFNGAGAHDARPNNVAAYLSPNWSGFGVALAYVANAEGATTSTSAKGNAYSVNATYDGKLGDSQALYVGLGYQSVKAGTGNVIGVIGNKLTAWKVGVGYTISALQINAVYEKTSDDLGASGGNLFGRSDWYVGAKYGITDSDNLRLAYGHAGNAAGAANGNNYSASQYSLGYDHNLSKRTALYAIYTRVNNNSNANFVLSTSGSTAGGGAVLAGSDPSAIVLGIRHAF